MLNHSVDFSKHVLRNTDKVRMLLPQVVVTIPDAVAAS